MPAIERSGLLTTDIEVLRLHYAETLRHWRRRFATNRDTVAALYDERFCRMFEFYLSSCELGFRDGGLAVFQIQLSHQQAAVPLTGDYTTDSESGVVRSNSEYRQARERITAAKPERANLIALTQARTALRDFERIRMAI